MEKKELESVPMKLVHGWLRLYNGLERNFMIIFTLGIGISILVDILLRTFGCQGLSWVEEMGRMMLVTTTIIGCSVAVKTHGHACMDTLYNLFSDRIAYVIQILANLISCAAYLWTGYYSAQWTVTLFQMKKSMETISSFPMGIFWVIITLGFLTMGARYLIESWKCVQKMRAGEPFREIVEKEM